MDIREMKPGRELDALVAEKVFRWRKVHGPVTDYDGPCESFDVLVPPTIEDPFPLYPPRGAIRPWWFCHKWSTEISDAWEVVEKMKTCGLLVDICQVWDGYSVIFDDGSDFEKQYEHKAETAPHAICIAAFLAMEDKA